MLPTSTLARSRLYAQSYLLAKPRARSSQVVGAGVLVWVLLSSPAFADETVRNADTGPWGYGGAYYFGLVLAFVFYGVGWAIETRKQQLAGGGK